MDGPLNSMWVEKYRPTSLEQVALLPEQRTLLESYLKAGEIPHLLLVGPPGSGKTTIAKILINSLDCSVLKMNASKDRGIDIIRDKVGTFAKVMMGGRWKIVFMDEADGLTSDAQNSMRALMEDFNDQTRFILAANYEYKIISPIQSRCTVIQFGETPLKERIEILVKILKAEGIAVDLPIVLGYAERFKDLRDMIGDAQKSVQSHNGVLGKATEVQIAGADIVEWIKKNNWGMIVTTSQNPAFDHRRALVDMFWAVESQVTKPAQWRFSLAKAVHESMWTPDPVVHFLGTCAELIEVK